MLTASVLGIMGIGVASVSGLPNAQVPRTYGSGPLHFEVLFRGCRPHQSPTFPFVALYSSLPAPAVKLSKLQV